MTGDKDDGKKGKDKKEKVEEAKFSELDADANG